MAGDCAQWTVGGRMAQSARVPVGTVGTRRRGEVDRPQAGSDERLFAQVRGSVQASCAQPTHPRSHMCKQPMCARSLTRQQKNFRKFGRRPGPAPHTHTHETDTADTAGKGEKAPAAGSRSQRHLPGAGHLESVTLLLFNALVGCCPARVARVHMIRNLKTGRAFLKIHMHVAW